MPYSQLLDLLAAEYLDLAVEGTLIRPLAPVPISLRPHLLAHKQQLLAAPRCACGSIGIHPFAVAGKREWQCSACMISRFDALWPAVTVPTLLDTPTQHALLAQDVPL